MKDWINNLGDLGRRGIYTAITSCLIGIAITLAFLITKIDSLIFVGIIYICCAGFVNLIVLAILIFYLFSDKEKRKENYVVSCLMLLNIPICFLCLYLAISSIHVSGLD